jgi:hypothetical protein
MRRTKHHQTQGPSSEHSELHSGEPILVDVTVARWNEIQGIFKAP